MYFQPSSCSNSAVPLNLNNLLGCGTGRGVFGVVDCRCSGGWGLVNLSVLEMQYVKYC